MYNKCTSPWSVILIQILTYTKRMTPHPCLPLTDRVSDFVGSSRLAGFPRPGFVNGHDSELHVRTLRKVRDLELGPLDRGGVDGLPIATTTDWSFFHNKTWWRNFLTLNNVAWNGENKMEWWISKTPARWGTQGKREREIMVKT